MSYDVTKLVKLAGLKALAEKVQSDYATKAEIPTVPEYTVDKLTTAETGYLATYQLKKGTEYIGAKINIPKDFLVKSASLATVTTADTPYTGAKAGDKYIDFVVNSKDGDDTASHIYLAVNDLVDVYTAGNGIDISDNAVAIKVATTGANGLSVDADGLKLATATADVSGTAGTAGAMSAADKTKLDGIATGAEVNQNAFSNITVTSTASGASSTTVEADGKTDTLTLEADGCITLTADTANDKVTIAVSVATDTEVNEMLTAVFGTQA